MLLAQATLAVSLLAAPPIDPAPAPAPVVAPFHCQVPCGIYGDHLRVELLREHCTTIEKAMTQIEELGKSDSPNWNQLVRWITTKDEHAQKIQDQINEYWLAQRVKEPSAEDEAKMGTYVRQLMLQHRMTVAAMKCKQTTDLAHVEKLRTSLDQFVDVYFSPEDREHLKQHGKDDGHSHGGAESGK